MTKMYYKNASAAVICFSMIEKASFEKAKTWVNELNQNADDVFVCLVATKCMCACAPSASKCWRARCVWGSHVSLSRLCLCS